MPQVRFLEEGSQSGLAAVSLAVQSVQDDYELRVRLVLAPNWPHQLTDLDSVLSLVDVVRFYFFIESFFFFREKKMEIFFYRFFYLHYF